MTKTRLFVACHDAGGAEVISSWLLRHLDEYDVWYGLAGPAFDVFHRKIGMKVQTPPRVLPEMILCGSSMVSDLERTTVRLANGAGITSIVWLDHWKNYSERFWDGEDYVMPSQVWVCDEYAEEQAKRVLPTTPNRIINVGNPYLEDFAAEVERVDTTALRGTVKRLLYVAEPGEMVGLERYLREGTKPFVLRVRLHPADKGEGWGLSPLYDGLARASLSPEGNTLAEDVAWAHTVLGVDSMALVAALAAGKHVVSVLPRHESDIPYPEIERPS